MPRIQETLKPVLYTWGIPYDLFVDFTPCLWYVVKNLFALFIRRIRDHPYKLSRQQIEQTGEGRQIAVQHICGTTESSVDVLFLVENNMVMERIV